MKNLITTIAVVLIFGAALFVNERHRQGDSKQSRTIDEPSLPGVARKEILRANGRIEGRTDEIELRARIIEQISQTLVTKGQWVSAGEVLLRLDSERLSAERDLAAALLAQAEAKKERLENGYRPSEIETARQQYYETLARLDGAEKAYQRSLKLSKGNAVSQQTLDDHYTSLASLQAMVAAAKGRLETLELPPRDDDLLAASASVRAAESRLQIAQINLDRTQIKAPIDGRILALEAEVGELTFPDGPQPLIIMSDTRQLRAVAEVDEFDALKVELGQTCQIASDADAGVIARGKIVEIEPQMHAKRLFGQWAGERSDTYSRRVWIELQEHDDLPVGLPVDVFIEAKR
jgi:multidrug resistance efflux pump